ncbi:unnamed protein product [Rotaria magnacalcarata]|uniref:Globin-sensor domain-containing protein n=2 Tax=Rotaria magnacalcarata TaxID=392030 RepID=A0A814DSD9_9BILA|nr:unnamed protein product [Rotaria magnacalcarata]CAF1623740.1 unnamed protein product [Rotaria magnacalcarata]CAF2127651.1 unnamed protein product [Rotaria magnacalcarata]CAF2139916.1 unnamed protein product [Rotaria magnacalcarata]CAF3926725.1 unnamed protein product [Rotaria magnacalcarata]
MMTEHIDKTRLNNDIRYRFDFISKLIDFSQDDVTRLNSLASIITPLLPMVIDSVYKKLFAFDTTKRYFQMRNDGFETFTPNKELGITLDFVQTEFRKDMLSVYLKSILTQREWNDSFLEYLSRVGQIHTNKGGSASINVDYIYMNALFCFLEQLLSDIVWNSEGLQYNDKRECMRAISKFVWIQNDLLTMHFSSTWNSGSTCQSIPIVKLTKCLFI